MENNIAKFRAQKGLTMQQLAELVGTSQQQIDRLEKGKRKISAEWMQKLSNAFGCKPAELVVFEVPKNSNKVPVAVAKVIGVIEPKFANHVREFVADEQYEITFKATKKDADKRYFGLVVEGGNYKNYPAGTELVFEETKVSKKQSHAAESDSEFVSAGSTKLQNFKFEIGKVVVEGKLVKSIRAE